MLNVCFAMLIPTDLLSPCHINGSKMINTRLSQRRARVDKVSTSVYIIADIPLIILSRGQHG